MKRAIKFLTPMTVLAILVLLAFVSGALGDEGYSENTLIQEDVYLPFLAYNLDAIAEPTVFGVQLEGNTGSTSPYYPFMIGSETSWVRVAVVWYLIEPVKQNPPVYNWSSADTFLTAARSDTDQMSMIATISGNPDWAADYLNGPLHPEDVSAYLNFVAAAVERYDGDGINDAPGSPVVNHWEIYNEPDRGGQNDQRRWGYEGDEYAQLLAAVYPVVKAASPDAQVLIGGLAYDYFEDQGGYYVREFLDTVMAAGGGNYFDYMNFHVYPSYWFNWTNQESPGMLEKANFIRAKLASYGHPNKPFIVSEAGWHSNDPQNGGPAGTPEEQARFVVELFTQALASHTEIMIWWMLHDPGGAYPYDNGLVTYGPSPQIKPSYVAFQTAVGELGTSQFVRILPDSETGASDMEAYEFEDSHLMRTVYVAWLDPIDTLAVKPLRVPASVATVRDIYGSASTVTDGQDGQIDGLVTVDVGGQPVYIEVG